jgi:hypothetical protein
MSVPDFDHEFDAEAETCFQQFKYDSVSYLMNIGQLFNEEIRRLRTKYTKVFQDESLEYNDRWRKLYDIRKEKDLTKRLRLVITDLIYLRTPLSAKNCTFKEQKFSLSNQNLRIQRFHFGVAKLRKANPGMKENEGRTRIHPPRLPPESRVPEVLGCYQNHSSYLSPSLLN